MARTYAAVANGHAVAGDARGSPEGWAAAREWIEASLASLEIWGLALAGACALGLVPLRVGIQGRVGGRRGVALRVEAGPTWPPLRVRWALRRARRTSSDVPNLRKKRPFVPPPTGRPGRVPSDRVRKIPWRSLVRSGPAWLKLAYASIRIRRFRIDVTVGLGDAAATALVCGVAWAFWGTFAPWLGTCADRACVIRPYFGRQPFAQANWDAELRVRLWRVVELGALAVWLMRPRALGRTRRLGREVAAGQAVS